MHRSYTGVRWFLHLLAAALWVTAPIAAQALGLGTLKVHSGLDEPLNAQIELISPSANELKTLKTTLASRADFEIAGVDRVAHLFDIKYSVSQRPGGQHILKLTTDNPVREPFLHFLIQVEWSGGRLIREYSALLDPPHWVAGRPGEISVPETVVSEAVPPASTAAEIAAAPTTDVPLPLEELPPLTGMPEVSEAAAAEKVQLTGGEPQPSTATASVPASSTPPVPESSPPIEAAAAPVSERPAYTERPEFDAMPAPAPAPAPVAATDEYGPVKTGDTLSQVVDRIQYDKSLTSRQVMLAMLRANPSAFFDNNVNNLKAGAILKVPESETIAAIPSDQAAREFRAQYDAWQEYKLKLAGASRAVAVAEAEKAPAPKAEPAKKADAKSAEKAGKAVKGKAEAVDLLKIVRANLEQDVAEDSTKTPGVETKKDAAKEEKVLTERVATLEEAIESKQMQNNEMRDRVGKLQDQVKNTERLIDLENKDLALAQKQAAAKQAADAKAAEEKAALEKAALEKAATAAAPAPQPEVKPDDAAKPVAPPKPAAAPLAAKAPVPPPPPEEGFLDGILASLSGLTEDSLPLALMGIMGVLAAGLAGLYAVRRRRASREFTESILSGSSLSSEVSSVSDTGSQAAASDTSFLSDFSQGGMGNVHTDEVDPIAEAEVYLAYGRDEQAEEILKDAIVKDPNRQELKGKLLEIYFQRNAVGPFETLAEELYAALEGKGGKIWDKVEEMGRKLSPTNPMFRGGKPAGDASADAAWVTPPAAATTLMVAGSDFSVDRNEQVSPPADQGLDFAPPAPADSGMDFNMDFNAPPAEPGMGTLDSGLNFDLGESASTDTSSGDIDFELPGTTSSGALDYSPSMDATDNTSDLDFSLGHDNATEGLSMDQEASTATAEAGLPGWDETATKLDLAKAYIDMGDADGARSILDEVIAEGNESQKQQARDLASQIAA